MKCHLPEGSASHSLIPTNYLQPLLSTKLDTFGMQSEWPHPKEEDRRTENNSKSYQVSPSTWRSQYPFAQSEFFWELLLHRVKGCLFSQQGHRHLAYPFRALFPPTTPAGWSRNHRTLSCVIMTLSPETARQLGSVF